MAENKNLIPYKENPAKTFLKRYKDLERECDALQAAIEHLRSRSTDCSVRMKPIQVTGGNGAYDHMAEDICRAMDAKNALMEWKAQEYAALCEIAEAIGAVPDEKQRLALTYRYINGMDWPDIQDKMGYERTQAYVIHGRALQTVNEWLIGRKENE